MPENFNLDVSELEQPHTCEHCQRIAIKPPKEFIEEARSVSFAVCILDAEISAAQLCDAVQSGCPLLCYVWHGLHSTCQASIESHRDSGLCQLRFELLEVFGDMVLRFATAFDQSLRALGQEDEQIDLRISAATDNPLAKEIKNRPRSKHALAQPSVDRMADWLARCHQSHSCPYKDSDAKSPPARVVKIQKKDDHFILNLHETKGASDLRWCALSYCWGADQPFKTIKATYPTYLNGVSYDVLPRTIQDAIQTTYSLGAEFLWVDALCIIQDDMNDLSTELGRMAQIYQESWVTIVASRAKTCFDGFLLENATQFTGTLPYVSPDGIAASVVVSEIGKAPGFEPIDDRAWTLQEGRLSPRIIEFSETQVRWRCTEQMDYDGDYPGKTDRHDIFASRNLISRYNPQLRDAAVFGDTWAELIENYSIRKLSVTTDKLPGISAVAQELGCVGVGGGKYLAGLWESELPLNLLWYVKPAHARPEEYIAPSWSWPSATGAVRLWSQFQRSQTPLRGDLKTIQTTCQVHSCETQVVSDAAPYGRVQSGSLVISGFWKVVDLRISPESKYSVYSSYVTLGSTVNGVFIGDISYYSDSSWEDGEMADLSQAICLQVAKWTHDYGAILLVLDEKETAKRFRRVGSVIFSSSMDGDGLRQESFWNDSKWDTFEII